MKNVIITEEIRKTVYEATDGTQFSNEDECLKYEKSALGVLNTRYKPLVICSLGEYTVFGGAGAEDYQIDLVRVKSDKEVDIVLQMFELINGKHNNESDTDKAKHLIQKALDDKDILLIGRGYTNEEEFWLIKTKGQLLEEISKIGETN